MNISDIAKLAGVSPSAVSRYLNDGYLSAEKKAAIQKVIEETGYRPLVQAQILRTRKTKTVGVIVPRIESRSISSIVSGIDSVLEEKGFQILLADTHDTLDKELACLNTFDDQRVDGVILIATIFTARHIAMIKKSRVPVVVVGQQLRGASCVFHDDYHAFCDITRLMLSKGCRRLGYIGAMPQDRAVGYERGRGYQETVRDAGLGDQAEHMAVAAFTIDAGREKARELWERWGPLDALVCAADSIAVGALQYLKSRNIQVPRQVKLTGQGASSLSGVTAPAITTIQFFYRESGADAAMLLLEQLENPETPPKEIKLGYTIVERESTR